MKNRRNLIISGLFVSIGIYSCINLSQPENIIQNQEVSFEKVPKGEYARISDMATGKDGTIFAADHRNSRVFLFDSKGEYQSIWDTQSDHSIKIRFPAAIAVDERGYVYVVCRNEIQIRTPQGKWIDGFSVNFFAKDIEVDQFGNIYLLGVRDGQLVHKYTPDGKFSVSFGRSFDHADPRVKRYYTGGNLAVLDEAVIVTYMVPYRIEMYTFDGQLIRKMERPEIEFKPNFEIKEKTRRFRGNSRGLRIWCFKEKIYHVYFLKGQGLQLDIWNLNGKFITSFPLNIRGFLFGYRDEVYYKKSSLEGASIYKGLLKLTD